MNRLLLNVLSVCWWIFSALADDPDTDPNDPGLDVDPYLRFKPEFARSLPIQILVIGIVLTLVAVLLIHIIFTAQYHWPLAPVNYILQLSGVITLLISLIATLHVVLSTALSESEKWPYMLSYIAVNVPPMDLGDDDDSKPSWSLAERATWLIMNATVSGLIQITHIQFLTLLYPSRLEGRLIFCLLGPLAVVAAVMQLIPINTEYEGAVITSAIRNVCNATLSLLFTAALFLWGLLVNRRQAWRTDGGTAVFGAAALVLALASTALNCLYVPREEEYVWLPGLMWAVVLWQSFLGWWWWVGAGSGHTAEDVVEEVLRRGEKISRKRREKRRRARARNATEQGQNASSTAVNSALAEGGTSIRRNRNGNHSSDGNHSGSEHELTTTYGSGDSGGGSGSISSGTVHDPDRRRSTEEIGSVLTTTVSRSSSSSSSGGASSIQPLPWFLPKPLYNYYANLRQAHVTAARKQAVERVERIRELERERKKNQRRTGPGSGWGLGSFAWKLGSSGRYGPYDSSDREVGYEMDVKNSRGRRRRRSCDSSSSGEDEDDVLSDGAEGPPPPIEEPQRPRPTHSWSRTHYNSPPRPEPPIAEDRERSGWRNSIWWWGPLRKWRLQDSTIY
ncbi:hypothetical protein VKT23_000532 [Stygiomarasmius scandens]|uniref:Uncharacterized protein n=1 Tax=Marasmiellus scandens TaxID=2682957 RepID=A0ABR1K4Q5_9AGAR